MKNKKIIVAGGSGFIGEAITKYFQKDNEVIILTRQTHNKVDNRNKETILSKYDNAKVRMVKWDGINIGDPIAIGWAEELEGADLIVNLAGKSVNCRYSEKNKAEILNSRVHATSAIGAAIKECIHPPKLWINASSATIYPHAIDKPNDEYTTDLKNDFSVTVCKEWENAFHSVETPATRKIALRMAITLGSGGIMNPYFNLLKFGLGGKQGNGNQMYSWIHIEDTCRVIEWLYEHENMSGVYNCCSPAPVTNKEFMRTLREATGYKFGLPAYTWMLKIGAMIIRTETELVLKSRWVLPTKLLESGFLFNYPDLRSAMKEIIAATPRNRYHLF